MKAALVESIQSLDVIEAPHQSLTVRALGVLLLHLVQNLSQLLLPLHPQIYNGQVEIGKQFQIPLGRIVDTSEKLSFCMLEVTGRHCVKAQQTVQLGGMLLEEKLVGRREADVFGQSNLFDGQRFVSHHQATHNDMF